MTVVSNKNLPVPFCLNRTAETKCCNCTKSPVEPLKEKKRDCKCHVDEDVGKKSLVDKAVSTSSVSVKKQTKTSQSDSFQQLSHKATSHTGSVRLSPQMKSRSARK